MRFEVVLLRSLRHNQLIHTPPTSQKNVSGNWAGTCGILIIIMSIQHHGLPLANMADQSELKCHYGEGKFAQPHVLTRQKPMIIMCILHHNIHTVILRKECCEKF